MAPNVLTHFLPRLRRYILDCFTYPTRTHPNARFFRFGIPWVLKITPRTTSTEAHALRFLHSTGLNLPIPRLIGSFVLAGTTYTIMHQVEGEMLCNLVETLDKDAQNTIVAEINAVLRLLATIPQPRAVRGQVMLSSSGHDLPNPVHFFETRCGPFPSKLACWTYVSECYSLDEFEETTTAETRRIMEAEPIVYVHADLRMWNVLVKDGHVTAIIDWEDSGWFPASWQVHTMRRFSRLGCSGWWYLYWKNEHRFSEEAEAAYEASKSFLTKYPA
ncbi:kinase-like protein [Ceratobasidium sp. AG-I]|nr:kinase-like protein [Ceratobasidium sp. AG-I]